MARKSGVYVTIDKVGDISKAILLLADKKVMVGVPASKDMRDNSTGINNAALAYIHEHGAPEANIPARPFLEPTVKAKQKSVIEPALYAAASAAFAGDPGKVERTLSKLGQEMADAVRETIRAGIPPPLKESTLIARARRRAAYKNAKRERKAALREKAVAAGGIPLIDTAQMLRAITWVLRKR
jgi:hypothetical protein